MSARSYRSSQSGSATPSPMAGLNGGFTPESSSRSVNDNNFVDVNDELFDTFHNVKLEPVTSASAHPFVANLHPPTNMSALQWLARVEQLREAIDRESTRGDRGLRDVNRSSDYEADPACIPVGSCFSLACRAAGVVVPAQINSVEAMDHEAMVAMAHKRFKVVFTVYSVNDSRNHIELVPSNAANTLVHIKPVASTPHHHRVVVCTTTQEFFNKSNRWAKYSFYAQADGFGSELPFSDAQGQGKTLGGAGEFASPPSIVGDQIRSGGSNVSGGVVRSRKRVIPSRTTALDGPVVKNYRTTNAVLFNNVSELFQDSISREYAQQIIEDLFETWGVPLDQPDAVKYAEDLLWTFLITVTASNKADYNRVYDVPIKPVDRNGGSVTEVEADFAKFSVLLASKYGITRRQFARGVADDLRAFLKLEENQPILPQLATRIGCEPLLAYLAFDGSTHCSNLTSRETTFTKTLESRNLFERDDVVAQGASDRLMQGMSGGVRAVSSR